jgi:iron complex transport system ATP-binding protein
VRALAHRAFAHRATERLLSGLVTAGTVPEPIAPGAVAVAARGIGVDLGGRRVLDDIDLEVRAGELLTLVGPNGAGKTTLLGALAGDVGPSAGEVVVDGRPLAEWTPLELARRRAVLPQQIQLGFPFLVEEVVAMGRSPWAGTDAADDDEAAVAAGLEAADAGELVGRRFTTLSGGERARVALARVLAQRTQVLFLDEPTAALDVHHQELVLRLLRDRVAGGAAVVVVLHDLGLAAAHADRVVVVAGGRIAADGAAAEVLTGPRLTDVYGHPIEVLPHPRTGAPLVLPER